MHIETITMDRVFDIQRRDTSPTAYSRTDFSFESDGRKHYAVQVPGWPRIEAGDRLTVVLGKAGDWQTLAGWKNHSTGEVLLPDMGRTVLKIVHGAFLTLMGVILFSTSSTPAGRIASGGLAAFSFVSALFLVSQWWRKRAQARAIQLIAEQVVESNSATAPASPVHLQP